MEKNKKYTVLIVDDEEAIRNAIAFDFERRGFNVLSSKNGTDAFEIVKSNKIDLVISDIRMPDGDGISLLEKIQAYNPVVPKVILVTGYSEITEKECLEKGAQKVFLKPFNRKALMNSAIEALDIVHT